MYRAERPHLVQRRVTGVAGGGGNEVGTLSILPEQEGQSVSGTPLRSPEMRLMACSGL
jgi:hypothetical protein